MDERHLIEQLKRGDMQAFTYLVDVYQYKVLATCHRFLFIEEDAEDVAQEVFLEVFNSIRQFRGDAKLSTWIYRIAITKSINEIRKQNRKKRVTSIGKIFGLDDVSHSVVEKTRPDTDFEESENWENLMIILNKLPDNQRIAFTLSKIDDYSNSEIADIMQTSVIAVDSLIFRAKQNLKKALAHWDRKN